MKDLCEAEAQGIDLRQLFETIRTKAVPAADVVSARTGGSGAWSPPWETAPSSQSVDGAALIQSLEALFEKYLVLPGDAPLTLALYAMMTYLVD